MTVKVGGKKATFTVNGKVTKEYTEPEETPGRQAP